ncbi:MAG TPA: hypothetical protein VH374_18235 [Polyangia bacterium]|nr:hypothetical protein [Polyangia bacterium]
MTLVRSKAHVINCTAVYAAQAELLMEPAAAPAAAAACKPEPMVPGSTRRWTRPAAMAATATQRPSSTPRLRPSTSPGDAAAPARMRHPFHRSPAALGVASEASAVTMPAINNRILMTEGDHQIGHGEICRRRLAHRFGMDHQLQYLAGRFLGLEGFTLT